MRHIGWWLAALMIVQVAGAQVTVRKTEGQKAGLDLSGFTAAGDEAARTFRSVLEADLMRSGYFVRSPAGQGV